MENIFSQVFAASLFGSSLGFFAAIAVLIIVCFASEVNENGFYAFGCFVLFCVLMHYKGSGIMPAFHFLKSHLWMAWLYLGVGHMLSVVSFTKGTALECCLPSFDLNGRKLIPSN